MERCGKFFAILAVALWASSAMAQTVFINEIHYDNVGSDVNEGVEIAGITGSDLTGWSLHFYDGSNGQVYNMVNLAGVLPSQQNGHGTLWFAVPGMQDGPADGVALVDDMNNVIEFLSYEGTLTGGNGPAAGMLSTDIGVVEDGTNAVGTSLQLTSGTVTDFDWSGPIPTSPGFPNIGQSLPVELQSFEIQ